MTPLSALVIDDSKSARFVLQRLLERNDCLVQTAESADEGLEKLDGSNFDVVFLDHMLPGTSGFEVLGTIRANPKKSGTSVIMCSSTQEPGFAERARLGGAMQVLGKPPALENLRQLLDQVRSQREDASAAANDASPQAEAAEAAPPAEARAPAMEAVAPAQSEIVAEPVHSEAPAAEAAPPIIAARREMPQEAGVPAVEAPLPVESDPPLPAAVAVHHEAEELADTRAAILRLEAQIEDLRNQLRPEPASGLSLPDLRQELSRLSETVNDRLDRIQREFTTALAAREESLTAEASPQDALESDAEPQMALRHSASSQSGYIASARGEEVDWEDAMGYADARRERLRQELRMYRIGFGGLAALDAMTATLVAMNIGAAPVSMLLGGGLLVAVMTAGLLMMHRAAEHRHVRTGER